MSELKKRIINSFNYAMANVTTNPLDEFGNSRELSEDVKIAFNIAEESYKLYKLYREQNKQLPEHKLLKFCGNEIRYSWYDDKEEQIEEEYMYMTDDDWEKYLTFKGLRELKRK